MSEQSSSRSALADKQYRLKRNVTIVGALINVVLTVVKIVAGVVGHSQALIADGVHSLSDLIGDGFVLFAARLGSRSADANHPYGHERIETVGTVAVGIILIAIAGGFAYDAVLRILNPEALLVPNWIVLPIAVASVLIKEGLYHYTIHAARRTRSALIEANAWHHRSDAFSSVVVVTGIIGALYGLLWFDAVATIIVAIMIGVMGWQFAWDALQELIDTGLDDEELAELRQRIQSVDGVHAHHDLRTRRMGGNVLIDVHVLVDPWISVSEGHRIAVEVRRRLLKTMENAAGVLVHVDVEEDTGQRRTSAPPPLRPAILVDLRQAWRAIPKVADAVSDVTLHYVDDRVHVDLHLAGYDASTVALEDLRQRLTAAAADLTYLGNVRVMTGPAVERHSRRGAFERS